MDSVIPLGQKITLAEYMILSGAHNRPPILGKDLEHERMILKSVKNGPLIWPTIDENRVTRTKKYAELSAAEKIQADCDMKATNIILQVKNGPLIWPTIDENRVTRTKKYAELSAAEKIQADCDMKATNIILPTN
nr:hypothetical protein [Tanacetum cinerariifolium]